MARAAARRLVATTHRTGGTMLRRCSDRPRPVPRHGQQRLAQIPSSVQVPSMDPARCRAQTRAMYQKTLDIGGTMSSLAKIKHPVLAACGLVLATAAILIGAGFVGSNSHPTAKPAGPWRAIADAPKPIAADRTTVWTGKEMIVTGVNPGSDGTFIRSSELAEAYNPATDTWRELAQPPTTPSYCRRDAVWTGTQMLVWGCGLLSYDPAANAWRKLPDPPMGHGIAVWTGRELIGWGGGCCGDVSDD